MGIEGYNIILYVSALNIFMLYLYPTKRGLGVELWGTYDDLEGLYGVIAKFWNNPDFRNNQGYDSRDNLISAFSYEIRKAKEGSRLKREHSHYTLESIQYFGCQLSYVLILFSLTALRHNMRSVKTDKYDQSIFLQLEHWLEASMNNYDKIGAENIIPYIEGGIYSGNEYLYLFMRGINMEYFLLGGGKKAFRQLPFLLKKAVYFSSEYKEYLKHLESEANRLGEEIGNLELSDDHIDYDSIRW